MENNEESINLNKLHLKSKELEALKNINKKSKRNKFIINDSINNSKKRKHILHIIVNKIKKLNNNKFTKILLNIEKKQKRKNKRNFGIDIARILSMIFLINHHILFHGGPLSRTELLSHDNNVYLFFNVIFISGVNIFGMISGFVGFHSHKYSNLIYLFFQTFLYNYGIAYYFQKKNPNYVNDLDKYLYPVFITDYWYFTAYFIIYFFFPLINSGIRVMERRQLGIFNLSLFLFFCCFNQIRHYSKRLKGDLFLFNHGFSYMWLLILYFLGGYFGKFNNYNNNYNKFMIWTICLVIIFIVAYCRSIIIINKIEQHHRHAFEMKIEYNSPSSVIIAICFVIMFSKLEINSIILQKIISFFAPLTYGVYLIHNHVIVRNHIISRRYIWLLKYSSVKLILMQMRESFKIFLYCSSIDFIRLLIFKLFWIRQICIFISKIIEKIANFILFIFEHLY